MWVYLDDVRDPPASFVLARNYHEAIELLETGEVVGISLDHDLGEELTGYDVLKWIEEKVVVEGFCPPETMVIHSANPVGVQNMTRAIASIERFRLGLAEC